MPTPAAHVWRQNPARSLVVDPMPGPRGTLAVTALTWPPKDPGDVLDYGLDLGPALEGCGGDTVATLDVAVTPTAPGDLRVVSSAVDGVRVVLWLGEGQPGTTYAVQVTVGTAGGRTLSRSVQLPVVALANPAAPANGLITDTGAPLLDQNGNPILLGA